MAVLILVVPMSAIALLHRLFPLVGPDFSDTRSVFHFKDGAWTPGPQFPGGLWGLEVSGQGAVWSTPYSRGGLCRLDGDHWTRFDRKQFGSSTDRLRGGFALRDEELWGASGDGAVRFDGQAWRLYRDALKTNRPTSMVAGRSGVWIVDRDGNLSHFDGTSWTIRSLNGVVPAAPPAGKGSRDRPPRLAMTGDGRVWLVWRGLWRQEGEGWREVRSPGLNLAEVWPIGHDGENVWLWLWRTDEVAAVTPDGTVAARYGWREMGLTESPRFDRLAEANGRIWIASSSGLLAFAGGRWTNRGLPPGCATITDVALAPDGSAWVLGEKRPLARIAKAFAPPLGAIVIHLVVIGLLISMWLHGRAENVLATEQALVAAAGHLPGLDGTTGAADIDRQACSVRWKLCAVLVGVLFVAVGLEETVWRLWPTGPAWAVHGCLACFVGLAYLAIWLWGARRRRSAGGPRRYRVEEALWEPAKWMLLVSLLLCCGLVPLGCVNRLIPVAALARRVRIGLLGVLAGMIIFGREMAAILVAGRASRAGDYDRALLWIGRLSFGRPSATLLGLEGDALSFAGRPAEAEPCYRQALAKSCVSLASSRSVRAALLGSLGEVIADQGRYEEATKCLQASIEMRDTEEGNAWMVSAELLLNQGTEPEKALELADEAMRAAKGRVAAKVKPRHSATRAWALALLGRRQEAEQAIAQAMLLRRETHAGQFANTRLNVGMALVAMEQPEKAIEHFRAAYEADPKGKYGARALQQIRRHGASGQ